MHRGHDGENVAQKTMSKKLLLSSLFFTFCVFPIWVHAQSALSVDVLWEAQTYVPHFYPGHTLVSSESSVRAIAIPYIGETVVPKDNLIFTWSKDGVQDLPQSGQGKNEYTFIAAKKYGKTDVSVSISSGKNSPQSETHILIPTTEPRVVLYPFDSARGSRGELAYGSQTMVDGGTVSIKAEPYYFSRKQVGDILFRWSGGGKILTPTDPDKSIMTLGVAQGVAGNVDIQVTASHISNLLQEAGRALRITFNQEPLRF